MFCPDTPTGCTQAEEWPPQSCPPPNPQNQRTCYVTRQGEIKVADGSKVANQVALRWKDYPGGCKRET